jgi:hypothetical protein
MAAATRDYDTKRRSGSELAWPVAAATKIYGGILIALNAAGFLVAAADTAGLRVCGVSDQLADNSAGANGDILCQLRRQGPQNSQFQFANDATNPVTQADLGKIVYVKDDHTVCVAAGAANLVKAGRFCGFGGDPDGSDATKCWIEIVDLSSLGFAPVATVNGSDAATTQALANALKAALNALA